MKIRSFYFSIVALGVLGGSAYADPINGNTLIYNYTDCVGGDRTEFETVKEPGIAFSYHLTDNTAIFNIIAIAPVDGESVTIKRGFEHNGLETVTCSLISPREGNLHYVITGFLTPVSRNE